MNRGNEVIKTSVLTVRIPVVDKTKLLRLADANGMDISLYVRKILRKYLEQVYK